VLSRLRRSSQRGFRHIALSKRCQFNGSEPQSSSEQPERGPQHEDSVVEERSICLLGLFAGRSRKFQLLRNRASLTRGDFQVSGRGIGAIRKALAEYVAMKPPIQLTTRRIVQVQG
jgi:hypothetical protein